MKARIRGGALAVLLTGVLAASCSLNPQPLPPESPGSDSNGRPSEGVPAGSDSGTALGGSSSGSGSGGFNPGDDGMGTAADAASSTDAAPAFSADASTDTLPDGPPNIEGVDGAVGDATCDASAVEAGALEAGAPDALGTH